jgi:ABC-type polysaccharide/polyol phosphate export permease
MVDNAPLMKRIPTPREIVPIAAVLSNAVRLAIRTLLLFAWRSHQRLARGGWIALGPLRQVAQAYQEFSSAQTPASAP